MAHCILTSPACAVLPVLDPPVACTTHNCINRVAFVAAYTAPPRSTSTPPSLTMSLPVVPDLSFASLAALGVQISARVSSLLDPTSFNPSFYRDNFAGQGSCGGIKQSPIELPGGITPTLGAERTTVFRMPQAVSGATIENKGTGIEVRRIAERDHTPAPPSTISLLWPLRPEEHAGSCLRIVRTTW